MRAMFRNRAVYCEPLHKNIFLEKFVQYVDRLIRANTDIQNCIQNRTYFVTDKKKRTKADKTDEKRML